MKKAIALLLIGSTLTVASCQPKPKMEENTTDANAKTTMMTADSASMGSEPASSTMGTDADGSTMMSTTTTTESTTK